jgi:hypothetical protein
MTGATHSNTRMLHDLADKLKTLTAGPGRPLDRQGDIVLRDAHAIITHVEISDQHGVGKLVRALFRGEPNVLSIRSANYYEGQQNFGDLALYISHGNTSRDAVFSRALDALGQTTVSRVLCIPYFPDDVRTAIALKEIFGVPLCTYLMDDQNVCAHGIPDDLMRELLAKSRLRLAISPGLCQVYTQKYGYRLWYMPPLAPAHLVPSRLVPPPAQAGSRHGVVIGNIWSQRWVDLLRNTVRNSSVTLTWYCNGEFRGLECGKDSLLADSIIPRDPLPEEELIRTLRDTPFAVVPTGLLDGFDDRRFIAQLSLPSRVPYMMATSHIPILVLGSRDTGVAHFVEHFGIGTVAAYDRQSFMKAVNYMTRPEVNREMRRKALAVAGRFSDMGAAAWIWQSLAEGAPIDRRYEDLLPQHAPDLSHLLSPAQSGPL